MDQVHKDLYAQGSWQVDRVLFGRNLRVQKRCGPGPVDSTWRLAQYVDQDHKTEEAPTGLPEQDPRQGPHLREGEVPSWRVSARLAP